MSRNFRELLEAQWDRGKFVCVGLDSNPDNIPKHVPGWFAFNEAIVRATADIAGFYKPNVAFYEHFADGPEVLQATVRHIHAVAPEVPVLIDFKRGDIGASNVGPASLAFDRFDGDAATVNPYLGMEALEPFLKYKDKGIIVLCRTSNKGAREFQDLMLAEGLRLYQRVALNVAKDWNAGGNCALVMGATYPEELRVVRDLIGDSLPFLIPGIGKQGGDLEKTVKLGCDTKGAGIMVNSSSGIIFASKGEDYAEAARKETIRLHDLINQYRKQKECVS